MVLVLILISMMMLECILLVLAALLLFSVYNFTVIHIFGVPVTLSESFYLFQSEQKGLGYLFTAMMACMVLLLIPAWLTISDAVGGWESNFTFLAFLAAGSIAFVGAAPAFRGCPLESKVHSISAKLAAFFALAWCLVVCWRIAYIVPIACLISLVLAIVSKTAKKCFVYWLEMAAFLATFAVVITECLLLW